MVGQLEDGVCCVDESEALVKKAYTSLPRSEMMQRIYIIVALKLQSTQGLSCPSIPSKQLMSCIQLNSGRRAWLWDEIEWNDSVSDSKNGMTVLCLSDRVILFLCLVLKYERMERLYPLFDSRA
jgi:hypothetical protein